MSKTHKCRCCISGGDGEKEAGSEVKKAGEEMNVWSTGGGGSGDYYYIGGSCWETAWKSAGGHLSVSAATLSITFHLLSTV